MGVAGPYTLAQPALALSFRHIQDDNSRIGALK